MSIISNLLTVGKSADSPDRIDACMSLKCLENTAAAVPVTKDSHDEMNMDQAFQ